GLPGATRPLRAPGRAADAVPGRGGAAHAAGAAAGDAAVLGRELAGWRRRLLPPLPAAGAGGRPAPAAACRRPARGDPVLPPLAIRPAAAAAAAGPPQRFPRPRR